MRTLTLAALVPALLALGVPAARAHDNRQVTSYCDLRENPDPYVLGGEAPLYGIVTGVAVTPEVGGGTLACEVRLNGGTVASTPPGHGEVLFVTAGQVTWTSAANDVLELCAHIDWDDGHPPYDACRTLETTQISPQEVVDALYAPVYDIEVAYVDPVVCPLLIALAPGVPGVLDIDGTGDTYLAGTFLWDCPPYQIT